MLPLIATGYVSSAGYLGGSVGMPLSGNLWPGATPEAIAVGNGVITVLVLGAVVFVSSRILHSDIGLELYALGVDERTAAAMGISTPRRKLELFVLGSAFAALGGAVYAGTQLFVPATLVSAAAELSLLIMLFVGGRRSILGAVVGALAVQYVSGASEWVSVNILLVEGALITVVLLVDPEGLAGIVATLRARLARPRPAPAAPAGVTAADAAPQTPVEASVSAAAVSAGAVGRTAAPAAVGLRVTGWQPPAGSADGAPLLECAGVSKDYGGLHVLDAVSLALPARGRYGMCGPNGAGKSTLLGVIGGTVSPSAGRVLLGGTDVTGLLPQQRFHLGVSRTFQAVHLIAGRTVLDNVAVSCLASHRSSIAVGIARSRLAEARDKAAQALDYLGMGRLQRPGRVVTDAGEPADGGVRPGHRPPAPAAAARRARRRAQRAAARAPEGRAARDRGDDLRAAGRARPRPGRADHRADLRPGLRPAGLRGQPGGIQRLGGGERPAHRPVAAARRGGRNGRSRWRRSSSRRFEPGKSRR